MTDVNTTVTAATVAGSNALSSAMAAASDVANVHGSSSWLGLFASVLIKILQLLSTILYYVIKLATISVPTLLYNNLISKSWTVTMNATTLMLIVAAIGLAMAYFVRYHYLTSYERLPPEPQRKQPSIEIFSNTRDEDAKAALATYLDQFISAIKIFGYLEASVYHELTRSVQTRTLIAGETLNLEEEEGFCLVVNGLVEIFVKSGENRSFAHSPHMSAVDGLSSSDDEHSIPGQQRYQLLTEVRNGAPMSSIFSIMSLFTEDVPLRAPEDETPGLGSSLLAGYPPSAGLTRPRMVHMSQPVTQPSTPQRHDSATSSIENLPDTVITPETPISVDTLPHVPPISLDTGGATRPKRPTPKRAATSSAHPDIIARATVDTTIAIIPASAFRRLIRIYPKATSHIVHVILSRFQRVTLATAYNYLGLTSEVMQIERNMLRYTTRELPNHLRGDALDRLKEKFKKERERLGEEEVGKGIALHNAGAGRRRQSQATLRKDALLQAFSKQRDQSLVSSGAGPSPGDLLGDMQAARSGGHHQRAPTLSVNSPRFDLHVAREAMSPLAQRTPDPFNTVRNPHVSLAKRESADEDNLFRESILECMFKALGLANNGGVKDTDSVQASPRLVSLDGRRQKAVFTTGAFGLMGGVGASADGDTESVASTGFSAVPVNPAVLAQEMKDEVEIVFFPKGSVLVEQGERNPGLYYVVDGFLDVCTQTEDSHSNIIHSSGSTSLHAMDSYKTLCTPHQGHASIPGEKDGNIRNARKKKTGRRSVALIKPGGLAGYIGTISSYRSFIDVVAKTDVYVGFLPLTSIEKIVDRYPIVLLTMAKRLTNLLPRLILHIDFALEWVQVNAGQVIFNEKEESEAIYIVLNGRLRLAEQREDGGSNVKAEYGQGESIGELEVLTESSRSGTLQAIRETELVKFPRTLFNSLAQEHPNITIKISKIIASRMRALVDDPTTMLSPKDSGSRVSTTRISSTLNLRTVAILPVTSGVPVVDFGHKLLSALQQVGIPNGATLLNHVAVLNHLGKHAFAKIGKLKLSQYLADLEEKYGLVIYLADTNPNTPWTQTCISQADCVLLVGVAEGSPEIGDYEHFMLGLKATARKILVLLHPERYSNPGLTRAWLKNRPWINGGHFHIQMAYSPNTTLPPMHSGAKRTLKQTVQTIQAEIQKFTSRRVRHSYMPEAPYKGDFHRLARRLCGKSVGLVLGGGGARGIAQIGIIRAMEEAGIPIDIIGGTSIGAFIGALYAQHANMVPIYGLAKKFAGRMASIWRFALDLTYPSASYTTGHEFNRGIYKAFAKTQIEDFWLEYYCNTTNISKSRAEFHTSGYAWRYVRASMSLAGLLPPLCDEGSMLLDGGYIDNLTVSHMKSLGSDVIFAVDVGALDDNTPQQFGDTLSGVWAFFNRWNPLSNVPNPPTLAEIQARLAYVSSVDALERAKTMPGCFYMRPPIDEYGTLDFGKFNEIYEVGYEYGRNYLRELREKGVLPLIGEKEEEDGGSRGGGEQGGKGELRRTMAPRRNSI
ncbi:hypothetical protein QBC40DRAFT_312410 [Triangularia verruculosa]|uniref:Lysophospholipase NTE1 n=1 Tax=Triangularia verruculosa TaxID=2587418 RepID=A0AAN6XTE3_9PEZI|nr:hypothetical protein QBC40DRAFT_312410 [Triangularia verruculosa]